MKSLYILFFSFLNICVCGQSTFIRIKDPGDFSRTIKTRHHHTKMMQAELTVLNGYAAGTTMDLNFALKLSNLDLEYGDSLAVTFPPGFVPNSSPTDPLASTTEGQGQEALNGVSGQVISWGDNDNMYGGMETPSTIYFTVNVTISPGIMGEHEGSFHVSGDQYADLAPPGDFSGTFSLTTTGAPTDLAVEDVSDIRYFMTPLHHFNTGNFTATVRNLGGTMYENGLLNFLVEDFSSNVPIPAPLNTNQSVTLSSSTYDPAAQGTKRLVVLATNGAESDLTNNSDTTFFILTDTLFSYNAFDTVVASPLSFIGTGILGAVFDLAEQDTLVSVKGYFMEPEQGARVRAVVYGFSDSVLTRIAASATYVLDSAPPQELLLYMNPPLIIPAGEFFVGFEQLDSLGMGVGYAYENFSDKSIFVKGATGGFFAIEEAGPQYELTPYLQPIFSNALTVGIAQVQGQAFVQLYPNPGNGLFTLKLSAPALITVRDLPGAIVQQFRSGETNLQVDLRSLAIGTYLLEVANEESRQTVRLVISE